MVEIRSSADCAYLDEDVARERVAQAGRSVAVSCSHADRCASLFAAKGLPATSFLILLALSQPLIACAVLYRNQNGSPARLE